MLTADARIGTELAGYRIDGLLGRGGMSVVYRAHDLRLKRDVALKLLTPDLAEDEQFRERFLRESQLAASLDHPNVVPVYEAGEAAGLLYIAMRYVPGTDLKARLREDGALEPARALALVSQIAGALDAAHERGLVHRDVKPSNVLLTGRGGREHCYLADFGLSTSASDRSAAADPGRMVGTIDYVAPEQIRDDEIDGRADVYSLACLLYECLTGAVPFRGKSDVAVIYAHLEAPAPQASERVPALPEGLDAVLARGMAKDPADRWQTCGALVDGARSALAGEAAPARRLPRRLTAAAVAAAIAAAVLAILLLGGGGAAVASTDSLVRIDADGAPAAGVELGGIPTAVTVCAGSVWVTSRGGGVSEVDPKTLAVHAVHVAGRPTDVADVGDLAAVVSGPPEQVTMIDASFGAISNVVRLEGAPGTAVAFGRDVWIASPTARRLDRLDPPYTAVADSIPLAGSPRLVAAGAGALWALGGRTLWRIDPGSGAVVTRNLSFAPQALAAGAGGVWLVDVANDAVVRVDPDSGRVTKRIHVGAAPVAVAVGAASAWVANRDDGTVTQVDAARNAVVETIRVGGEPVDLVAGLGGVWVVRRT